MSSFEEVVFRKTGKTVIEAHREYRAGRDWQYTVWQLSQPGEDYSCAKWWVEGIFKEEIQQELYAQGFSYRDTPDMCDKFHKRCQAFKYFWL